MDREIIKGVLLFWVRIGDCKIFKITCTRSENYLYPEKGR